MKLRKTIAFGVVASLFATSLVGCSSNSTSKEEKGGDNKAKLTFQLNFQAQEKIFTTLDEITNEFEKENSNIDIELIAGTSENEALLKTKMAANDLPDLWSTHGWSVDRYSEYLRPLNDQPWVKDIAPQIKPMITNKKDEIFVLPTDVDVAGLVFNNDVLKKSGVNPDDIKTWKDFEVACEKIKAAGFTPIHVGGKDNWTIGNIFDWIAPSVLITDEKNYQGDALIDGSFDWNKWEDVANLLTDMNKKGYFNVDKISSTYQDTAKALAQGQVAFTFQGGQVNVEAWKYNKDADLGIMPIPAFHEGDQPSLIAGEKCAIGVWKDTKHEKEALKYLEYLSKPENIKKLASATGLPAGLTTAKSDTGKLAPYYEKYAAVETFPYFDRKYLPSGAWDSLCSTGSAILTGKMTNKQAAEQMKKDYERLRK